MDIKDIYNSLSNEQDAMADTFLAEMKSRGKIMLDKVLESVQVTNNQQLGLVYDIVYSNILDSLLQCMGALMDSICVSAQKPRFSDDEYTRIKLRLASVIQEELTAVIGQMTRIDMPRKRTDDMA